MEPKSVPFECSFVMCLYICNVLCASVNFISLLSQSYIETALIAGLTAGVVSLLFISVTTIALTIWVTKYRLKSSSTYALKKRPSSVELNLGTNVEARFSSQTSKESPV